jgi:hypothetical protein
MKGIRPNLIIMDEVNNMPEIVEDDEGLWFSQKDLFNLLDETVPYGSADFVEGWESLAGYIRLEFAE